MKNRIALLFFLFVVLVPLLGRTQQSGTWPFVGAPAAAPIETPSPPPVLLADYGAVGSACCSGGSDAGAVADQHLFKFVWDYNPLLSASPTGAAYLLDQNCPGVGASGNVSGCTPIHYMDFFSNRCVNPATLAAYQYEQTSANTVRDEAAFVHSYGGGLTVANRYSGSGGSCTPIPTNNSAQQWIMNRADSSYATNIYNNVLTYAYNSGCGSPPCYVVFDHYQIMEDDANISYPGDLLTEYGNKALDQIASGSGANPAAVDYVSSNAVFANNMCQTPTSLCVGVIFNCCAPGTGNGLSTVPSCNSYQGTTPQECYGGGYTNDALAIDNMCTASTQGNLLALTYEEIIHEKNNTWPGELFLASEGNGLISFMDTHVGSGDGCGNSYVDEDTFTSGNTICTSAPGSGGDGACGDIAGGEEWRTMETAWRWLFYDPATGIPDRYLPHFGTINDSNGTGIEAPAYFESTMVPQGPEIGTQKFQWNGATCTPQNACYTYTTGDGCDASGMHLHGDAHGMIDLRVWCDAQPACTGGSSTSIPCGANQAVGDWGGAVFVQQYKHLYIYNGTKFVDYGPAAALVNTSVTTTATVSSSWFARPALGGGTSDAYTAYNWELNLGGANPGCSIPTNSDYPTCVSGSTNTCSSANQSAGTCTGGGELSIVNYPGIGPISTGCTDTTYCNGRLDLTGQTLSITGKIANGTLTMPPTSGLILFANNL